MKNIIKFLIMLFYLISIFYINNIFILIILIFVNFSIMILFKITIIDFFKSIIILIPFIFFTVLINYFIVNYEYALFIGIRLLMSYMISYIFIKILTIKELVNVIDKFLSPLKLFRIDYKKITLIIFIAISIVPNILNELQQKIYSLKSKLIKISPKNFLLIIKSILLSMILKVNEFENALMSKGYSDI